MPEKFIEDIPPKSVDHAPDSQQTRRGKGGLEPGRAPGLIRRWASSLLQLGLGEPILRAGTTVLSLLTIGVVIWLMQVLSHQAPLNLSISGVQAAAPTPTAVLDVQSIPALDIPASMGIPRGSQIHTNVPTRPRVDIIRYIVQEGDTVFGIAEKFGLQPQTILWGNYGTLLDDPHSLQPGQDLIILPSDGVYWQWSKENKGGLISFAEYFKADPQEILNAPANKLDPASVGDLASPNIPDGTWLFVPGGEREFISWSAPLGVTRENPASALVWGAGACGPVNGAVGYGTFVWPANKHYISGYNYTPKANHMGIDIAGSEGEGVYAADAGVVVYAGHNDYGYGNMIMIDHGDGFQTLYAHLSAIYRGCGDSVGQGEGIGAIGSTGRSSGPHLHFEIRTTSYFVNPWDYLPPP